MDVVKRNAAGCIVLRKREEWEVLLFRKPGFPDPRVKKEPFLEMTIRFFRAELKSEICDPPASAQESEGPVFVPVTTALHLLMYPEEIEALSRMLIRLRVFRK